MSEAGDRPGSPPAAGGAPARRSPAVAARLREMERPLRRSPLLAGLAILASGWLVWDMWPDLAYFLSSGDPVELGDGRGDRVASAPANRLVRVSGPLVGGVAGTAGGREPRRVGGLLGADLAVDRPAGARPALVMEGRLLPEGRRATYEPFVAQLRRQGWTPGDRWRVLREGERPRQAWGKPLLATFLVALAAFNVRSLVRHASA